MPWYPFTSHLWRLRIGVAHLARPQTSAFGPEQSLAWTSFYLAEAREQRCIGPEIFAAMLSRHGCPDVGNPLSTDDESHFLLHPGGFIAGEFDRILRASQSSLDEAMGEQALLRIGLLAHLACPMISARAYWADEDLKYAMALVCLEGRWELFGARAPRVIVNSLRLGLLEPEVAPGLLIARRIAEEQWHRPPWRRGFSSTALALSEPTPPPELNLSAWRERRVASLASASPPPETAPSQEER